MSKVIKSIVRRANDGNYYTFDLGAKVSNITMDTSIYDRNGKIVIDGANPDTQLSMTNAFEYLVNYIGSKSLDNWVYQYKEDDDNTDFLAHISNNGLNWKNPGDIILYPKKGGATFGTSSRLVDSSVESVEFLDSKQYNSLEIGKNNSTLEPGENSVVIGSNNTTEKSNTLLIGTGLSATRDNQLVVGEYNTDVDIEMPLYANVGPDDIKLYHDVESITNQKLRYNTDAVFVVGAGKDNNNDSENATVNAFEIYDKPSNASEVSGVPSSLVHTAGNLMVDGDSILNRTFLRDDLITSNLYVLGDMFIDSGEDNGQYITIDTNKLAEIINFPKYYEMHTHKMQNANATVEANEDKIYKESGEFVCTKIPGKNSDATPLNGIDSIISFEDCDKIAEHSYTPLTVWYLYSAATKKKKAVYKSKNVNRWWTGIKFKTFKYNAVANSNTGLMHLDINFTYGDAYGASPRTTGARKVAGWYPICKIKNDNIKIKDGIITTGNISSDLISASCGGMQVVLKDNTLYLVINSEFTRGTIPATGKAYSVGNSKTANNLGVTKSNNNILYGLDFTNAMYISIDIPIETVEIGEKMYTITNKEILITGETDPIDRELYMPRDIENTSEGNEPDNSIEPNETE